MAILYGKSVSRVELERRVGSMSQVAGIQRMKAVDGMAEGVEVAEVRTGSGFEFTVNLSRGMDIAAARFCGRSLCWMSQAGMAAPGFFDPQGENWLNTFGGGLLVTCGLTQVGFPNVDEGQELGLHGRISHIPARRVNTREEWVGDEYEMTIEGEVIEAIPIVTEHIRFTRKITTRLGESRFFLTDTVENFGYKPAPHMLTYHINFGYPILDDNSRIFIPSLDRLFGNDAARNNVAKWQEVGPPVDGFPDEDYYHRIGADADGQVLIAVANPELDGGTAIYYKTKREQFPWIVEWKQLGPGAYITGVEPSNCQHFGRATARQDGSLQFLQPGEKRQYDLELGVVQGKEAIAQIEEQVREMK